MLLPIREALLDEARQSPGLLSDLAGLESYIAESYSARSFIELLQNADDAGARRFTLRRYADLLLAGNDGRPFSSLDFESLCRSASSAKARGATIGYRGIGFKSVVSVANSIQLFSGDLAVTFSRDRTAKEVPGATRWPLIRIPHEVTPSEYSNISKAVEEAVGDGYVTVFVFSGLIPSAIEAEFDALDPSCLLFLRHISRVELRGAQTSLVTVQREQVSRDRLRVCISADADSRKWSVVEREGVSLAFFEGDEAQRPARDEEAVVHAFLPTLESTGFPFKVNADFSTDPSRTRIVLDEVTSANVNATAALILDLLASAIEEGGVDSISLLKVLMPSVDPRLAQFQRRSFVTELLNSMQRISGDRFAKRLLRPAWIGDSDFDHLALANRLDYVPTSIRQVEGLSSMLKFLSAREATLEELTTRAESLEVTRSGAADIIVHLSRQWATKSIQLTPELARLRIWSIQQTQMNAHEAATTRTMLDRDFVELVQERGGLRTEVVRLLAALIGSTESADRLLPPADNAGDPFKDEGLVRTLTDDGSSNLLKQVPNRTLKRWRSAEQQVQTLLQAQGWRVDDVSKQNLGYDLEARDPNGSMYAIEVKSLDEFGQSFTLTNNELSLAQRMQDDYILALVRQTGHALEVALIRDPGNRLSLVRQCRQWVWECGEYSVIPQSFPVE